MALLQKREADLQAPSPPSRARDLCVSNLPTLLKEATIIRCDATRMDLRFDASVAPGPYQIVLRRMNAGGKSYALARLKVEVVAA